MEMALAIFPGSFVNRSCMAAKRELSNVLYEGEAPILVPFSTTLASMSSGTFTSRVIAVSRCFLPLTCIRVVVRHSNVL